MSNWLTVLSVLSLAGGLICAVVITVDVLAGRRQPMWIMNIVWPVTALYSGPLGLWAYCRLGRASAQSGAGYGGERPFWRSVALGATHCGSGCTLGDIVAEWLMFLFPFTLWGKPIFAAWVIDYVFAYLLGIAFQYYSIKPMRGLSPRAGLVAAVKADTLSLSAWQVGMYGWMAVVTFLIFGHELEKTSPVFWFMMQIAMIGGFLTSYPMNWWLLRRGIKERM